jgi:hypothetical protein
MLQDAEEKGLALRGDVSALQYAVSGGGDAQGHKQPRAPLIEAPPRP